MSRAGPTLDLISSLALAGAATMILVRPAAVSRIAASPLVRRGRLLTRTCVRRIAAPENVSRLRVLPSSAVHSAPAPRLRTSWELARLIAGYMPARYRPLRRLRTPRELTRSAGRRLNDSAATLALSVLADSAIEHYRGSFQNRAMYTPLAAAALTFCGSLFGSLDPRAKGHAARDAIYATAVATGFAGLGFHAYNILKRPGGWSWLNLFYAAPIGAPMALALAGLLGRAAERVRNAPFGMPATLLGLPAGRMLAAVASAGLAGTIGEAALLHFRGAYHDPAMVLPVTVPPVASALLATVALSPSPRRGRIARWWLRLTASLGFAGVGFHILGVARNMGGWRNWSQNILNGPPLPAPPSFTGLALAGLAALSLIEEESDG